ncbi:MAG: flagellar filament capping protein FliD [Dehalococcoidia bacterium]
MVSGSSGRITFGGLASGIDTNTIIEQLIQIERRPITLAENRLFEVQQKTSAFGSVASALSSLLERAQTLNNADTYRARGTSVLAKEVDANKVQASATSGAAVGAYTFNVTQIATQTVTTSDEAVGAAVDADAAMDVAGFGTPLVTGTFSINGTVFTIDAATARTAASAASVGAGFDATQTLENAGLDIVPTAGSFTINGVNINFDPTTDKISDVIGYINSSSAGVTASFDEGTQVFTLTHDTLGSGTTITMADGTGNFLEAMKLLDSGGGTIAAESAGTDVMSLNDVIDDINNAGIGVTASLVQDGDGRDNLLQLTSASTIQLGSGGDSSNFLSVTSLLQSPPGTTRTSQRGLGGVSRTDNLSDARLATTLSGASGSFKVNGVEIAWDAEADSLTNLLTRINNSDAGVTVTYDAFTDKLKVTNDDSGALAISFEDVTGNMAEALGFTTGDTTMGQNAAYSIDGGPTRYSTSNTITDAIDGVTLTVNDTTTEAVKVNINQANNNTISSVDAFVTQFNKTLDTLGQLTAYSEDGNNGVLFGDGTVRRIEQELRSIVTRGVPGISGGLRTLSDVGVSYGAVGAAVGTANRLVFDTAKFQAAMTKDPEAVAQLMTAFTASASLSSGGTGSIASISGSPTSVGKTGRYSISSDASGNLVATFSPADGSTPVVKNGTITAGGTNTTLIPGLTLTGAGSLQAGADEILIGASSEGFAKKLSEWVESLTRTGGLIESRNEEMGNVASSINEQIDRLEARVSSREQQLIKKFTAMELAISQLQSQQQALTQMATQMQSIASSRRK